MNVLTDPSNILLFLSNLYTGVNTKFGLDKKITDKIYHMCEAK